VGDTSRGADYEAGLDGLRAVAVLAVVFFHSEFEWAGGGFLGVSIFFTLSGFLITRLLLIEQARSGSINLVRFWKRRLRRLAPASLLCLAAVTLFIPAFAASGRMDSLRLDLLAAIGYSANWRFVLAEQSYADLFLGGPSPVLHFWSLAIEEQFYVVLPLVIAAAGWCARRVARPWIVGGVLVTLTAASLVAGWFTNDRDLYYYGTHTRAAEFLIGSLSALVWLRSKRVSRWTSGATARPLAALSVVAIVGAGWLVVVTRQSDEWLYHGGFPLLAALWAIVILGAMTPGPLRSLLSSRPMVVGGKLSFGIYLFHWPIFLLLTPDRLNVDDWRLHAMRWATTLAAAAISYALVEQPIRTRQINLPGWSGVAALSGALASVVVLTLILAPATTTRAVTSMVESPDDVVSFDDLNTDSAVDPTSVDEPPTRRPVVVVVGSDAGPLAQTAAQEGFDLVDLTQPCSFLSLPVAGAAECPHPAKTLAKAIRQGDVVDGFVVGFGELDHRAVAERLMIGLERGLAGVDEEFQKIAKIFAHVQMAESLDSIPPTFMVDYAELDPDPLSGLLREAGVMLPNVRLVERSDLVSSLTQAMATVSADEPRRTIIVVGDSTSFGVAEKLDELANERYEVVWAGYRNCPWVAATEVRWWEDAEFTLDDCLAQQAKWERLAALEQPSIVLAVASLPEVSDQRYGDGDTWYAVGDAEFERQHIAALRRLSDMVAANGGVALIADAPRSEWTSDERVAAFNRLLSKWIRRVPSTNVLTYGEFVDDAEAAAGRSLRPDNVHLEDEALRQIVADHLLPQIDAAAAELSD
jgi:peptidoglycan/LPS O-acetylase OafA/YrhL